MNGNPMPNNVLASSFRLRPDNVVQGAGVLKVKGTGYEVSRARKKGVKADLTPEASG
jgi:hypothetical protein